MPTDDKNNDNTSPFGGVSVTSETSDIGNVSPSDSLDSKLPSPPPPPIVQPPTTPSPTPMDSATTQNDLPITSSADDYSPPPPPPPFGGNTLDSSASSETSVTGNTNNTGETTQMVTATGGSGSSSKKFNKKIILPILAGLLLIGGVAAGVVLVQQNQDIREQAGSIGQWGCLSEQGLAITSNATHGSAGDLGYKPLSSDDANNYSMGDTVSFQTKLKNTTESPINTSYVFVANKVIEAPKGQTPADNLNEVQMYQIHDNQGTTQQGAYNSGKIPVSFNSGEEKYISDSWIPTECGYYQIDMLVDDFIVNQGNNCPADKVVAAGFIKVIGCSTTITASCTNIKAYDASWNEISRADLATLKAGDVVNFAVAGTTSEGKFNKARFDVDGTGWRTEVTTTVPGKTNEFYDSYTIPANETTFSIKAQVYHETEGWR